MSQCFKRAFLAQSGVTFSQTSWWIGLFSGPTPQSLALGLGELPVGSYGYSRVPLTTACFSIPSAVPLVTSLGCYVNTTVIFSGLVTATAPASWQIDGFALYAEGSGDPSNYTWYSPQSQAVFGQAFHANLDVIGNRRPQNQDVVFPVGSMRFDFATNVFSSDADWYFKTRVSTQVAGAAIRAMFGGPAFHNASVSATLTGYSDNVTGVSTEADFDGYSRIGMAFDKWEPYVTNSPATYDPTCVETSGLTIGFYNRLPLQWINYGANSIVHIVGVGLYGYINGDAPPLPLTAQGSGVLFSGNGGVPFTVLSGNTGIGNAFPVYSLATYSNSPIPDNSLCAITIPPNQFKVTLV